MENSIVKDFQNLRVLSSYDFHKMDQLVQDLTNALEETSRQQKTAVAASTLPRKCCKKRRSRKYRVCSKPSGNISEASESSLDEQIKDYIETIVQHSDSDELHMLAAAQKMTSANLPLAMAFPICPAESDSVNENISPVRPHRRRRRFKRMAVDPHPEVEPSSKAAKPVTPPPTPDDMMESEKVMSDVTPGKRKWALRDKSFDLETLPGTEQTPTTSATEKLAVAGASASGGGGGSSSGSCLSSSESELSGLFTNDEAREGDDEHSDFYYEPTSDTLHGVQTVVPWWDHQQQHQQQHQHHQHQQQQQGEGTTTDPQFEALLTGSLQYMSSIAKQNFRHRLKMLSKPDREIRAGKRRLKDRKPAYSLMRFIQDRQQWSDSMDVQQRCPTMRPSCSSTGSQQAHDHKRRRKTPPPSEEGEYVAKDAAPIPESNIGNRLLQNMGWKPGTGLGQDETGMVTPIQVYKRNGRAGLGTGQDYMPSS